MRFFTWSAGFLEQGTAQSSSRLLGIMFGAGTLVFAFLHPDQGGTILILGGIANGFIFQRGGKGETTPLVEEPVT